MTPRTPLYIVVCILLCIITFQHIAIIELRQALRDAVILSVVNSKCIIGLWETIKNNKIEKGEYPSNVKHPKTKRR